MKPNISFASATNEHSNGMRPSEKVFPIKFVASDKGRKIFRIPKFGRAGFFLELEETSNAELVITVVWLCLAMRGRFNGIFGFRKTGYGTNYPEAFEEELLFLIQLICKQYIYTICPTINSNK